MDACTGKSLTIDNQVPVVGDRNITEEYFQLEELFLGQQKSGLIVQHVVEITDRHVFLRLVSQENSIFPWRDLAEVAIGACIVAFPIAATEETWNLSEELSLGRTLIFAIASFALLAICIHLLHNHRGYPITHKAAILRIISTYGVALLVSGLLLLFIDRLELFQDPLVALKRTIFVAFSVSFAATTVDGFSDRS